MALRRLPLLLALVVLCQSFQSPIKHVVVFMMENHSFDNMLGWLDGVGDLDGTEYNLLEPNNTGSKRFYASKGAAYCTIPDPQHSYPATGMQVFSPGPTPVNASGTETMGGFAYSYTKCPWNNSDPQNVMNCFTPDQVPIISTLAQEFLTCTNFYASIPGPTFPNRFFIHTGGSMGYTENLEVPIEHRSIYEDVAAAGLSWAIHYQDFNEGFLISPLRNMTEHQFHDPGLTQFYQSIENGTLRNYTFLVPLMGPGYGLEPTSQHPSYDVRSGEAEYKRVYENLRASPYWNDTLFVLIYDEHGGFWDKKVPPTGVPNPCPTCSSQPDHFDFDRLGVRLPAVFASPWLPKLVDETMYEHTSVLATVRQLLGLAPTPLTPREAATNNFVNRFLTEPRTDCPMKLPEVNFNPPLCRPPLDELTGLVEEYAWSYDHVLKREGVSVGMSLEDIKHDRAAVEYARLADAALRSLAKKQ